MKQIIEIKGMSCAHCVMHVKEALMEIEGITEVEVDLEKNTATILSNEEIKKEIIVEAIENVGYQVLHIK